MEREDILRIIDGSPLSFHLSDDDKMKLIERILSIIDESAGSIPKIEG